ncbi:MAG: hypothetical protein A3E01_00180 [Gammaproteobacteria bacterium RIFCSPHIGHO2_12_FULL_63_22]|nr:MAG: hypothetical protein A3E01_00180 [Gammaproteobacteria bacterium RIFCSPHIGHO2_12_FULL_63_22]
MATYEVDVGGSTYEVDAPDETTAWKWANATHVQGPKPAAAPAEPTTAEKIAANPLTRLLTGVASPFLAVAEKVDPTWKRNNEQLKQMEEAGKAAYPGWVNAIGTAANVGGAMASPPNLAIAGAMPVAQGATGLARVTQAMQNMGSGAVGGGAMGFLTPGDTKANVEAGALGGAVAGVGIEALKAAGAGARNIVGPMLPKMDAAALLPQVIQERARKLLPQSLQGKTSGADRSVGRLVPIVAGNRTDAVLRGLDNAAAGETAGQAAVSAGSAEFSAFQKLAEKHRPSEYLDIANAQHQGNLSILQDIAGGANKEAQGATRDLFKQGVNATTLPLMRTELNAANTAGDVISELGPAAAAKRAEAANAVQDVRRFTAAGGRADAIAQNTFKPAGQPRVPGRYTYADELAQRAERVAQQNADLSLQRGAEARFIENQIGSLEAHGLKPLDTAKIAGHIDGVLDTPGPRASEMNQKVLGGIKDLFTAAAERNGGTPNAYDVYMIRKQGVNEVVDKLTAGMDPKQSQKLAAKYAGELKPLIDDAIEAAGGSGWRDYLKAYSDGMAGVNRMSLGGKALDLYQNAPKAFQRLATGNDPKTVEKIMGTGTRTLAEADPYAAPKYQQIADAMFRNKTLDQQAKAGMPEVQRITGEFEKPVRPVQMLDRAAMIVNAIISRAEGRGGKAIMTSAADLMRDPQRLAEVVRAATPNERQLLMEAIAQRAAISGASQGATQ